MPSGISEPRIVDLLLHAPDRGRRPPRHSHRRRRRARHHRHAGGARPQAQAGPARQQQGPLQGDLRGRHRPHRSRVLPRRAQIHRAPAAGRHDPLHQRPRRGLQRRQADGAPRLHRGARGQGRPAAAGAGLSADRWPVRQGPAEGRAPGPGARARAARMAGSELDQAAGLARCPHRARPPAPPAGCRRRLARLRALDAACLRRAAGRPAGAGPGTPELQEPARPPHHRRRPHPCPHRRCPALRAHQLAAPGTGRDRRGHGRPASHAAAAAGRRRLRQDGGGADGHGGGRRGRRAGGPDGPHRGAGPPARRHHGPAGRSRRPAPRPAHRPREGPPARRIAASASPPARSTS